MKNENAATAHIRLRTLAELTAGTVTATRRLATTATTDGEAKKGKEFKADIRGNKVTCVNGTFSFTDLVITVEPGNIHLIEFTFDGFEDNGINRSFISKPYV